ncbi:uncharacterized protein LOC111297315 [Durio zibethinus]|uniref:Uncharacterized protein LOC111297315 n=1 Tax=Durio zibethinus TaxID=66656 RepID=A0A6P5Z5W7_DURZI|nr:uncharacterized protein LOC111297315 [Durio zibethinus]
MQKSLQFKSQFLHFRNNIFLNPFIETSISLQSFNCSSKSPIFTASPLLSRKTQIQKPIICARKGKSRHGSARSTKFVLELISILASNLKILPQPLDLIVQNLVSGDGRELAFLNGFKGIGFNGWRRPTTKRRNGKKILGFLAFLGSCFMCLLFGKELRSELLFGVIGFIFFVFALIKEWRRGHKNWVFGFCCVGIFVGLGLRKNEAMKWIKDIRVSSSSSSSSSSSYSSIEIVRRGKRRGRWAL